MDKPIRVLVAKPGLDGHDRGAKVVAHALRDAGFEVIYTGLRQTPEQIAKAALQEDVLIIGGGVIPDSDIPALKEAGIAEVFTPGTDTSDIVKFINENVK